LAEIIEIIDDEYYKGSPLVVEGLPDVGLV